jgi:CHASE2 domain-containing sensor protein
MRINRRHRWWLITLAAFLFVAALDASGQLRALENAAMDLRAGLLKREVQSDIVIVGIDSASVRELDSWPWPRRHHAKLLEKLTAANPRRVFFDVDFSSPSNQLDDAMLDAALARRREFPVSLPTFTQFATSADSHRIVSRPLPRFARSADLVAVNATPGADGLTREWRNYWTLAGERTASIIDPRRVLTGEQAVIIDYSIEPSSFTYVSYVDVLEGRVPHEVFTGKPVFVGATALELGDVLAVPVYGSLPGIVVQALASETVTLGAPKRQPQWGSTLLLAFWTLVVAVTFGGNWRRNLVVLVASTLAIVALSVYAFEASRLLIGIAAPLLVVALMFIAVTVRWLETQTWRALAYAVGMRRRDALLKSVVQSSTDTILCIDDDGIIKMANPAAARLFGCAAYELVDEPVAKFITLLAGEGAGARLPDLAAEPRGAADAPGTGAGAGSLTAFDRAADARPLPLQGGERHAGPQRRRPRVVRGGGAVPPGAGRAGLHRAHRRRRVHRGGRPAAQHRVHRHHFAGAHRQPACTHRRGGHFHRGRRQHRHRAFPAGRQRGADAAAARGRGHVPGQAARHAVRVLRLGARRELGAQARHRRRVALRDRGQPA